ncbi:MAG: nucleotidyl transferase AbiEii/AbiGii toxin family protein [Thermoanaerobaculia bacterium]
MTDVEGAGALHPASSELLARLATTDWIGDFYLAGSAALALHLRHRPVRDLDFMALANRLAPQERRDLLTALLELAPGIVVETARDGYLHTRTAEGIALRFFYYPYPLVAPVDDAPVPVAALVDLGLMKLGAVASRGSRRDFVDLHLLCRQVPLADLLARSGDKFGHVEDFPLQAMKGLADTVAAEGEPMPALADALAWSEVEEWIDRELRAFGTPFLPAD